MTYCHDGLDVELTQMAQDDSKILKDIGVNTDRERNLVFYLDNFLDDLCTEMECPAPEDRMVVIKAAFRMLRGKDDVDLTDIRRAVAVSLGSIPKKISFPENELEDLMERLDAGKDIYTTRISAEKGRYCEGDRLESLLGQLEVVDVEPGVLETHPFFGELTRSQKEEIGNHEFDLVRLKRVAYPNMMGVMESNKAPERDIGTWLHVLGNVLAAVRDGESHESAANRMTEGWDPVEKLQFEQWSRYYRTNEHEKYAAVRMSPDMEDVSLPEVEEESAQVSLPPAADPSTIPRRKRQEDMTPTENKKRFLSRIDAAKRILRFLGPPIMNRTTWNWMYESLSKLEREIAALQTVSTMRDAIIRTANSLKVRGLKRQANGILKIAQPPPGSDVTRQIERALTGGGDEGGDLPPPPGGDLPPPSGGDMPAPEELAGMAPGETEGGLPPEGAPAGAMEDMPPPPEPPKEEEKSKEKEKGENPYAGSTVPDVLGILEPLVKRIKERKQVRELSKADMMMEALGIVSYFPELGEAMARMIESEGYITSRLEKIIGKLKGGEKGKSEGEEPPTVEMGGPEETALEISSPAPSTPSVESAPPSPPGEEAPPAATPPPSGV